MKVGYFAPMPPAPTGVADYAAALLEELRKLGNVRLDDDRADVRLYQIGNNHLHREIYRRAMERPGVVVLHDAVLHHYFLGSMNKAEYIAEFTYNYGAWHSDLAANLWRNRARSGVDATYFRYPMLKRLAERSQAIIVHNAAAARMVRDHSPDAKIVEIPHLFAPPAPVPLYDIERLRQSAGVRPSTAIFGIFGHLRESKRLPSALAAFDRIRARGLDARLLVAGQFVSSDLARAMEGCLDRADILRVGYLSEPDFWRYASAVDACISLRYPPAGETSGIAIRLMGLGKPVILTAGEESARYPDDACLRVDAGPAEVDMLAEYMEWLARFPADARAIGERAARHVREHHAPPQVASQFWSVLTASASASKASGKAVRSG